MGQNCHLKGLTIINIYFFFLKNVYHTTLQRHTPIFQWLPGMGCSVCVLLMNINNNLTREHLCQVGTEGLSIRCNLMMIVDRLGD